MPSVFKKLSLVIAVVSVLTACVSTGPETPEDLSRYLPQGKGAYGWWDLRSDPEGRDAVLPYVGLSEKWMNKLKTAVFACNLTEDIPEITAVVSGEWSSGLLKMYLSFSSQWRKTDCGYYSKEQNMWIAPVNSMLVLANYPLCDFIKTGSNPAVPDTDISSNRFDSLVENEFFKVAINQKGLPDRIKSLKISDLDLSLSHTSKGTVSGSMKVTYESEDIRRLVAPLTKVALIGSIMDTKMDLPVTEYEGSSMYLKNFGVPYKKLLETYIPLVMNYRNMIDVE